eukprot:1534895-Alexandrium_andersonii.AAC.1
MAPPCGPQGRQAKGVSQGVRKELRYAGCDRCAGGTQGASAERGSVAVGARASPAPSAPRQPQPSSRGQLRAKG